MKLWQEVESVERFAFGTMHKHFYDRCHAWFAVPGAQHFVMWRVADGTRPRLQAARLRLEDDRSTGPSAPITDHRPLPDLKKPRPLRRGFCLI
ncbi:DUF3291 domain-containing protein [Yoonia vestfoldensis]|uniref:DUF3291 domain-containing protein n=1 Tax=Yoonia vestfoldensis TaxID=245188 RepID=UPI000B36E017